MSIPSHDEKPAAFPYRLIISLAISRLFMNFSRRFYYPFIPEIARNLNVPVSGIQQAAAVQAGVGIFSPLFGGLAERYGRKRVMLGALALMNLASLSASLLPLRYGVFLVVMMTWGFAKWLFDPAMQAYISDRIPYEKRGLAIGITEWAWAGALLIGGPMAGFLLEEQGLRAVYWALLGSHLLAFLLLVVMVPGDSPEAHYRPDIKPFAGWGQILSSRRAMAALAFSVCLYTANEMLLIVYADWLETTLNLKVETLGVVAASFALAEVLGEGFIVFFSDRIGKWRLSVGATILSSLGYVLLSQLGFSLVSVTFGLFILFFFVEIAIVASIPLFTEVLPEARSVMMSSVVASQGSGRFIGAFLGGTLYAASNFTLTSVVACGIGLLAAYLIWAWVGEN